MISLLASIVGFLSSIFPDLLKFSQTKLDKKYEIELLDKKIEIQKLSECRKLESAEIKADIEETKILHQNFSHKSGIIESLNQSVRPILAYFFFALYGLIKIIKYSFIEKNFLDPMILDVLWEQEDQAIFAAIISFYFGQRSFNKFRKIN